MRHPWMLLWVCLGACGPVQSSQGADKSLAPEVLTLENAPAIPPPMGLAASGTHQWTRLAALPNGDTAESVSASLNDAGQTGVLALLKLNIAPDTRLLSTLEWRGWSLEGQPLWQHRAPGIAPNVPNGEFPWYYEVHPRGDGFLIVNSWEREYGSTRIDFGCTELLDSKQANRLLLIDGQGACTRSLGIEYVPTGVATSGEDFWISRRFYGGAGAQWPSMQRRDAMNQVLTDVMVDPPPPYLTHVSQSTLLSWGDGKLSRRSESFEPLWSRVLPIFGLERPAELPDGQLAVVGRRSRPEGFTFGTSVIPPGDDFVMVRLSAQGKPLGAVATGIPTRELPGQFRSIATDAQGVIIAGGETGSVVALSWTGLKQWERAVKDLVPELCLPKVHSVTSHGRHGVRVVGLGHVPAAEGVCVETAQSQRTFVIALTR